MWNRLNKLYGEFKKIKQAKKRREENVDYNFK